MPQHQSPTTPAVKPGSLLAFSPRNPLNAQRRLEEGDDIEPVELYGRSGFRVITPFSREDTELISNGCLAHGMTY